MKNKKIILVVLALVVIGGIVGYNYIYQDHRDIESEKAAHTVQAANFIKEFQVDEEKATEKYLNKTIAVDGILTSIDGNTVVIGDVVFFALSENETPPASDQINTTVQVKGRCIGYDSLLEEVKLDQATVQ